MEEESYADIIDAYESGVGVLKGESLTDYIKRNNIKIKEIRTEDLTKGRPMENEGIMQASTRTIDPTVTMEEIVMEFIKENGRKPNSIDELKEFYFKKTSDRGSRSEMKMASGPYTDDEIMMYEQYKYDMNEQRPGMPIMEIDDFLRMELGSARMGVRAGGLPGILGV
jgi:hypothetical protein|tara:strand:- start:445 stop:948 length:504 start_codon:yes stop_codon:yes gene_type:complete